MAQNTPETAVYVSNAGSKEIFAMAMDRATGEMRLIEKTIVPGTDKPSPASLPMAVHPTRSFLYAQLRSEPFPVSTFAIDKASGKLHALAQTPLIDGMAYLTPDRAGRFLLCASYSGSKLGVYPIDGNGIVGRTAAQITITQPKAHCIVIDAANRFAYATSLGGDIIIEMEFDPPSGVLSQMRPGEIATKTGAGPRHLAFHPNGRFLYLITETTATIGTYAIGADGHLRELQFVDTGDYNGKDSAAASDIHVTPDGRFLYGAVRSTSTLHGYAIDPTAGTLTAIGKWPTEKTPRGFNIDPRGKFLLSAGMDSNSLTVHAIDGGNGNLAPAGHYPMGSQPNWIEIVDLKP